MNMGFILQYIKDNIYVVAFLLFLITLLDIFYRQFKKQKKQIFTIKYVI